MNGVAAKTEQHGDEGVLEAKQDERAKSFKKGVDADDAKKARTDQAANARKLQKEATMEAKRAAAAAEPIGAPAETVAIDSDDDLIGPARDFDAARDRLAQDVADAASGQPLFQGGAPHTEPSVVHPMQAA